MPSARSLPKDMGVGLSKDELEATIAKGKMPGPPAAPSVATTKVVKANVREGTKLELLVRQCLREAGLTDYRLQWKVPGHPDVACSGRKMALRQWRFWHHRPHCKLLTPRSNVKC